MKSVVLVRDLCDDRIVYYFHSTTRQARITPKFCNLELAHEWYLETCQQRYEGVERRASYLDRRGAYHDLDRRECGVRRDEGCRRGKEHSRCGRRYTDRPLKVELDLAGPKLEELKHVCAAQAGATSMGDNEMPVLIWAEVGQ